MNITDFLLARINDDEQQARDEGADAMTGYRWKHYPEDAYNELQSTALAQSRRTLAECATKRRIVELHKSWPVLVETPPTFDRIDGDDLNNVAFRASQQIQWLTEQEYRTKFGNEPPTAPILAALAAVYADHDDYDETWRPRA